VPSGTNTMPVLYSIIGLLHAVLFLIAAFEILTSKKPLGSKLLWLLAILLLPVVGLIAYYVLGRG
jgi:Phospholipase_D-nuclease N-terminal